MRYDFYDWLDVPMVADRWRQYEANDYVRIESLDAPVRYRTTPYFPGGSIARPFRNIASGMRLRVKAHRLPEVSMATPPSGFPASTGMHSESIQRSPPSGGMTYSRFGFSCLAIWTSLE